MSGQQPRGGARWGTARRRRREARHPQYLPPAPAQAIAVAALLRDRGGVGPSEPRPPLPEGEAGVAGPGSGAGTFVAGQQEELLVQRGLLLHLPHVLQRQQLVRRGRGGRVRALVQSGHGAGSARPIRARAGRWRGAARPPVPAASPAGAGRRAPARSAPRAGRAGPGGGRALLAALRRPDGGVPLARGGGTGAGASAVPLGLWRSSRGTAAGLSLRSRGPGLPTFPTALSGPGAAGDGARAGQEVRGGFLGFPSTEPVI